MNLRSLLRQPWLTIAFHEREARWTVGARGRISSSGQIPLPAGLENDGVITDPERAGAMLREAPDFRGSARMQVLIALPAQRSVFRHLDLPVIEGKKFDELVGREIRRELPMLADNAHVSWARAGDAGGRTRIFVAGVARDVLDSHVAAVRAAGLTPVAADLRVIAAARAVGATDSIIANVEEDEIEIGIFRHGVPAIIRYVRMSARHGEPDWTAQLGEELARTLKFYRDSHKDDLLIDQLPISLVGGAARDAILGQEIGAATGFALAMPELKLRVVPEQETVRFAANVGLALKDLAA